MPFQNHRMAFLSYQIATEERGKPVSVAGGKVATVTPWHNILHHVYRLCSSWQGGQAMCWLLRDSVNINRDMVQSRDFKTTYSQTGIKISRWREMIPMLAIVCVQMTS